MTTFFVLVPPGSFQSVMRDKLMMIIVEDLDVLPFPCKFHLNQWRTNHLVLR